MKTEPRFSVHVDGRADPLADGVREEALAVLEAVGSPDGSELSLLLVGDPEIRELNRDWRGIDSPTDVLSFPQDPDTGLLGDVVVNLDAVPRQAEAHGMEPQEELRFLLIHGVLHLLGWDHADAQQRSAMEAEEQRLWEALGGTGSLR